jgi:hypothetical protein
MPKNIASLVVFILLLHLLLVPVQACETPVFLYALENWLPEVYELLVFHRGKLSKQDSKAFSLLHQNVQDNTKHANIRVVDVDIDGKVDAATEKLWASQKKASLPWVVALYPYTGGFQSDNGVRFMGSRTPRMAWSGRLTESNARALVDSPLRQQIAKQLVRQVTAVWILLESGNRRKDDNAYRTLQTELARMERALTLPPLLDAVTGKEIDAKPTFSLLRLSRGDEAEQALVQMLLNTERDLQDIDEPIVFPIFGRGIVLYALVGAGINGNTIADAAEFLTGSCSCEAKALNPGVDLLMKAEWDNLIKRKNLPEPRPTGIAEFGAKTDEARQRLGLQEVTSVSSPAPSARISDGSTSPKSADATKESDIQRDDAAVEPEIVTSPPSLEEVSVGAASGVESASQSGSLKRNLLMAVIGVLAGIVVLTVGFKLYTRRRSRER